MPHRHTLRRRLWPRDGALALATLVVWVGVITGPDEPPVRPAPATGAWPTPEAALLRSMIDAFAVFERALRRSRTKAALAVKKVRVERVGGIPYGYRTGANGKLVEDAREQEAGALARRLRFEGASLRDVAAGLREAGFQPRTGKRWHVAVLARLVAD